MRIKDAKTLSVLHSKHTANYTGYVAFTLLDAMIDISVSA